MMENFYFEKLTHYAEKYIAGDFNLNQSIQGFLFENKEFKGSKSSVSMYLEAYRHLIIGEIYKRNINTGLHLFYLEYIKTNYDLPVFQNAILSTKGHLEYRFNNSGQRLKILDDYIKNYEHEKSLSNKTISNVNSDTNETIIKKSKVIKPKIIKIIDIRLIQFSLGAVTLMFSLLNFFQVFKEEISSIVNGFIFLSISLILLVFALNKSEISK